MIYDHGFFHNIRKPADWESFSFCFYIAIGILEGS